MGKRKTTFKTVNVHEDIYEKLSWIADSLNKSRATFIEEVVEALFDASSNIQADMKLNLSSQCHGQQVWFTFTGRQMVKSGHIEVPTSDSAESVDRKILEELKKQNE